MAPPLTSTQNYPGTYPFLQGSNPGEWTQGPSMTLSGNKSEVKIFHIPAGHRYKNYRKETWNLSPGASCSVTYVVADSKSSIDQLKHYSDQNQFKAALSAMVSTGGEPPHSMGASAELGKSSQKDQKGSYNESHSHAAIVVSGETINTTCLSCFPSHLDVSIEVLLEPMS